MAPIPFLVHLAEDSDPLRELFAFRLEQLPNVRVTATSTSAFETLSHIRSGLPDLLVLDLQLDQSSALDVLRDLVRVQGRPRVAILTNHSDHETRETCRAAGADAFFDKSTEFDLFLESVRRLTTERTAPPPNTSDP
jgi:DNA-binding NarL/FixJ family response regulator